MKVNFIDLIKQSNQERHDLKNIFRKVLNSGNFVGGKNIENFEKKICNYIAAKNCISLNSGTDALVFALFAAGIKRGDEIITTPNSFIASTAVIVHLGAKPIFVDVLDDQNIDPTKIEEKITKKTKAIMPVHLTGRVCKMDQILKIAKKYSLTVIEDAAQAIGSKYNGVYAGNFGDFGCFSAHPLKNLNAIGDSGYLVTKSKKKAELIRDLRNHGMSNRNRVKRFGFVSRMDNIQAAILNYRLGNLKKVIQLRRNNFEIYKKCLDKNFVYFPTEGANEFNTYHTFVIQAPKRDKLKKFLKKNKIETAIHYPIPIHLQPAAKKIGYKKGDFPVCEKQSKSILTLPINQFLKKNEIEYISEKVNKFFLK
jgi:dTDP-4-amino-4,6-dideoxygalactose transaminase